MRQVGEWFSRDSGLGAVVASHVTVSQANRWHDQSSVSGCHGARCTLGLQSGSPAAIIAVTLVRQVRQPETVRMGLSPSSTLTVRPHAKRLSGSVATLSADHDEGHMADEEGPKTTPQALALKPRGFRRSA